MQVHRSGGGSILLVFLTPDFHVLIFAMKTTNLQSGLTRDPLQALESSVHLLGPVTYEICVTSVHGTSGGIPS
ncbi:hypothetical protein F5146DRAFT_1015082 [Armillaria mellea]|nr:hypothetical protein F5146DRAFT_1015082 [Armillaria mellea]